MTRSIRLLLLAAALMAPTAAGSPSGGPTLRVVSTTDVGGSPSSLTTAAGDVWVSLGLDGVARLDRRDRRGRRPHRAGRRHDRAGDRLRRGLGDRRLRRPAAAHRPGDEHRHERDPRRRPAERRHRRPRLGVGAEPARLDGLPGRPGHRPRDGDDSFLPGELWPGGILATPSGGLDRHGRGQRRRRDRPGDVARHPGDPRPGRTVARVRARLRLGRACACRARSSGSGAAGSSTSPSPGSGRTATARGWQAAASSGWRERTRSCGSGRSPAPRSGVSGSGTSARCSLSPATSGWPISPRAASCGSATGARNDAAPQPEGRSSDEQEAILSRRGSVDRARRDGRASGRSRPRTARMRVSRDRRSGISSGGTTSWAPGRRP